ncbi:MAG: R2-like ligand-binding oxidase [Saprospiraceae bacterium]
MKRTTYQTINGTGLNRDSFPMRLWEKAKIYGIWNPNDFDFAADKMDWDNLTANEKKGMMNTLAQFQAGEEAVTLDLLPLIMAIAKEGRLEEEMYLTSFLWEEAKHVDGFNRFLSEVVDIGSQNLESHLVPSYKTIFHEILPNSLHILNHDPSPVNIARASVTYNMIIEGTLAETGYFVFHETLYKNNIMPNMMKFIGKLKQDESRHIAYGLYLLARLISENGNEVWEAIQDQMNKLLPLVMKIIEETYEDFEVIPFGINPDTFSIYAMGQFQKRMANLEKARKQSITEINMAAISAI